MNKIAFIGVKAHEKLFFEHALDSKDYEIAFYSTPFDVTKLNPQTTVLSVFVDTKVTAKDIAALPRLKLIACRSTGTNNVDADAAQKADIQIKNVTSYGATTVAEYTFALLLMLSRNMNAVIHESISSEPNRTRERGMDLAGKTIGIVGTGNIGLGVARIARGFGMKVIGCDPYPRHEEADKIGFSYTDCLNTLLKASDIVSLHAPLTPENMHLINAERLELMKNKAILLNTARGELVDTTALLAALRNGKISAAGFDVLEDEQFINPDAVLDLVAQNNHAAAHQVRHALAIAALARLPNVIITNHNAYNTTEALEKINQTTVDNILAFLGAK